MVEKKQTSQESESRRPPPLSARRSNGSTTRARTPPRARIARAFERAPERRLASSRPRVTRRRRRRRRRPRPRPPPRTRTRTPRARAGATPRPPRSRPRPASTCETSSSSSPSVPRASRPRPTCRRPIVAVSPRVAPSRARRVAHLISHALTRPSRAATTSRAFRASSREPRVLICADAASRHLSLIHI